VILCSCQDEIIEPDPEMVCVDCIECNTHMMWKDAFCGSPFEADRFISETMKTGYEAGMTIKCWKK
jgi:hypothetical protein